MKKKIFNLIFVVVIYFATTYLMIKAFSREPPKKVPNIYAHEIFEDNLLPPPSNEYDEEQEDGYLYEENINLDNGKTIKFKIIK